MALNHWQVRYIRPICWIAAIAFVSVLGTFAQAPAFGQQQISPDNVASLVPVARYALDTPSLVAVSQDGLLLAVAPQQPAEVYDGTYRRPDVYNTPGSIVIYDFNDLTAPPTVIQTDFQRIIQVTFAPENLLVLGETPDGVGRIFGWQMEDGRFSGPRERLQADTAFALAPDGSRIYHFRDGAAYISDGSRSQTEMTRGDEPIHFAQPIGVAAATFNGQPNVVFTDREGAWLVDRIDSAEPNVRAFDGVGENGLVEGSAGVIYFAEGEQISAYLQVETLPLLTASGTITHFDISPNDLLGATLSSDGGGVRLSLWDLSNPPRSDIPAQTEPALSVRLGDADTVAFTPDLTRLITTSPSEVVVWSVPENALTQPDAFALSDENLLADCDGDGQTAQPPADRLGLVWSWYAADERLLRDHHVNAVYDVTIGDNRLYHWTFITQAQPDPLHNDDPTVYYYTPLGQALSTGTHLIELSLAWREAIEDGYDRYGPGTENPIYTGACLVAIP